MSSVLSKDFTTLFEYNVIYNKNTDDEVSDMPENQIKLEDETIKLSSNNPARVGYTFKGWATSESSIDVAYNPGVDYITNSDLTLYAIWELNAPTVTLTASNTNINLFDDVTTTFAANVGNTINHTYKWYYNDAEIAGATSSTYSISTNEMTENNYNGGTYKVVVTNAVGNVESSQVQTVEKTISTAQQMKNFANRVNNQSITFLNDTVTQIADVDLSTVCSATLGSWTPIGTGSNTFRGTYNGQNHEITNLYINNNQESLGLGLFGVTWTATINDVIVRGTITSSVNNSSTG